MNLLKNHSAIGGCDKHIKFNLLTERKNIVLCPQQKKCTKRHKGCSSQQDMQREKLTNDVNA